MTRRQALAALAALVPAQPVARVAVDGPDAAGKTILADELAALLGADRVTLDDHLRRPEERYRRGRESPEGYYLDSFNLDAFRDAVLSSGAAIVVADGVFLLRSELDDLWDVRVFVDCSREEILRRARVRDSDAAPLYRTRYLPAQERYRRAHRPEERADAVVDNSAPASPRIYGGRGRGRHPPQAARR